MKGLRAMVDLSRRVESLVVLFCLEYNRLCFQAGFVPESRVRIVRVGKCPQGFSVITLLQQSRMILKLI